ncbi:MAG: hypothetical protein ACWIPI_00080 [Polaribacter sp.]
MRNLFLITVISLFLSNSIFGQSTPKPSKTSKTTFSSSSKNSSYLSFDTDSNDNSSVSIKRNDNVYKFAARFDKSKIGSIKKLLIDKLGDTNLSVSGDTFRWVKQENGEKLYDCKLTGNRLKIFVDKKYANETTINKMSELGDVLKETISGTDSKEIKENATRELKDAERNLKRAKRRLERIGRKLNNEN